MNEINEKAVNLPRRCNKSKKEDGRDSEGITK